MSTRCSIVYTKNIHIYQEICGDEICIDLNEILPINEEYGTPVISREELYDIYKQLRDRFVGVYVDDDGNDKRAPEER